MNLLTAIYTEVIYRPLLNGLVFVYTFLPYPDLGLAIFVITLLVRLLLHPTIVQMMRSQFILAKLQPELREIQERFREDKAEQARRTMALYREYKIHPLSGCVPVLIQLPILIGLYQLFWKGIALTDPSLLYAFIPALGAFNPVTFGVFDLTRPSAVLAIAAGLSQLAQAKFLPAPEVAPGGGVDFSRALRWQTTYVFPVIIAGISWSLPSALAFYWTVLNLLAIVQQLWIQNRLAGHESHPRAHQPNS